MRKRDIREDLSDRISMHVKFMSYKIETVITEELLRNLFSIYGEVCDTTIKQISIDRVRTIPQPACRFEISLTTLLFLFPLFRRSHIA